MKRFISIAAVYFGLSLFAEATGIRPEVWTMHWWVYIGSGLLIGFGIEGIASAKYDAKKGRP